MEFLERMTHFISYMKIILAAAWGFILWSMLYLEGGSSRSRYFIVLA